MAFKSRCSCIPLYPMFRKPLCNTILLALTLTVILSACLQPGNFEKNIEIPKQDWNDRHMPTIAFTIKDTTKLYDVYITLRHTDAYAYRNLWLHLHTRQPSEKTFRKERFELLLQDEQGRWLGRGMDDIYELRIPLFNRIRFTQTGEYTLKLEQIMRDNPLKGIMNIGIRIEQTE